MATRVHTVMNPRFILDLKFRRVVNIVFFLPGDSPASEFYVLTFRNTLSVPSSKAVCTRPMKMEQTKCSETSAHKIQAPRNQPKGRIKPSVCTATQQFIEQLSDCQSLRKNAAAAVPSRQPAIPPVGLC